MTRSQLITLLVLVTIICSGSALLLLPEPDALEEAPVRLVDFPPSQVLEVIVEPAGSPPQRLRRTAPDRWEIELPPSPSTLPQSQPKDQAQAQAGAAPDQPDAHPASLPSVRWPASTDRVHAFLRILDRLRGIPARNAAPGPPALSARITGDDGQAVTIGLPASSLGGRSIVRLSERPGHPAQSLVTTDELTRLLSGVGLAGWLDHRAFAGVEGQPMQLVVVSGGSQLRLLRAGSGWRVAEPFAAQAEAQLVEELLRGLQTLAFSTPAVAEARERPAPATSITLTSELRRPGADGEITTETSVHSLETSAPADAAGRIPALLWTERSSPDAVMELAAGPLAVELDANSLTSVVRHPQFYLARRSIPDAAAGDVKAFAVTYASGRELRWMRESGSWAADGEPLPALAGAALDGLATLLTEVPATAVAWIGEEGDPEGDPVAAIACLGIGGAPIARLSLSFGSLPDTAADARKHAILSTAGVARYYTPESTVEILRYIVESGR